MKFIMLVIFLFLNILSCSTSNSIKNTNQSDEVVSRIDNLKERPEWLKESEPFKIQNGFIHSLGSSQINDDERIEAGQKIAESNAKSNIAKGIEQKLEYIFQNAEEGLSHDANQVRSISSEISSLTTNAIILDKYYWEKYRTSLDNGSRVTRIKVFTVVKISEADFKTAVINSIKKNEGKKGISKDFSEKVDKQWEKLISTN